MGQGARNESEEEFLRLIKQNREEKIRMNEYIDLITDNSKFLEVEIVNDREQLRVTRTADFSNAILGTLGLNKAKKRFFALIKKKSQVRTPNLSPAHTRLFGSVAAVTAEDCDRAKDTPDDLRWWQKKQQEAAIKRKHPSRRVEGPTDLRPVRNKRTNYRALLEEQRAQDMSLNQSDLQYQQLLAKYQAIQELLNGRLSALCHDGKAKELKLPPSEEGVTLPALRKVPVARSSVASSFSRNCSQSLWSSEAPANWNNQASLSLTTSSQFSLPSIH
eukprot:TRINITY_DN16921_c0_g1_i1.p1 TRINITY_DN16921_c0_g1~~TRINITY_DN16921_c0_g1_i1.p1  ORF type:complete len:275 (+),score=45.12 TRINITY_DN16921_c0_g1_i1:30-854(+)